MTHYHVGHAIGGGYMPDPDGLFTTDDFDLALGVLEDHLDWHDEMLLAMLDDDGAKVGHIYRAYQDARAQLRDAMLELRAARTINTSARGAIAYAGYSVNVPNNPASEHDLGEDYWLHVCEEDCELASW